MPAALPRDIELDLNLESEARTTLTLVGILLAVLVVAALIAFSRHSIVQFCRQVFHIGSRNSNKADTKGKGIEKESQVPATPPEDMPSSHPFRERPSPVYQLPGFFNPIRKHSSTPRYASINLYRGARGLHTPPPAKLGPGFRLATSISDAYSVQPIVTPHIAGWMAAADSAVGAHPNARPLHARVATQAEIDMVSGHVHIPWAFKVDNRPPPIAVKVRKPDAAHSVQPPQAEMLRDVGNVRGRQDVDVPNESLQIRSEKRVSKTKHCYRTRGKENMPVTSLPSSSARGRF